MKKVCMIFFLVFASAIALIAQKKTITKKELIEEMTKVNNIYSYKGDVSIKVRFHDENYSGVEGMAKNEDKIYKAYFDLVDKNAQKIIFYADKDIKELEISITKGNFKLMYDKKDISKNWKTYKKELSKYPYTFLDFLFYEGETPTYLFDYVDMSRYIEIAKQGGDVSAGAYFRTDEECYVVDLSDYYGGAEASMNVSKDFHVLGLYVEDNGYSYEWNKDTPKSVFVSSMPEGISVEFLDENGWIKK